MPSIKKNLLYNTAYQILAILIPLITSPYLARVLGPGEIGKYSYTYSIVFYFMIIGVLGINNYGNRSIAQVRDEKSKLEDTFSSIYSIQLFMCSLMICAYGIYLTVSGTEYRTIAIIQGLYILSNLADITWFFYGLEEFRITVTRNALVKIASLALILLFVKTTSDTWIYTLIMGGSTLVAQIITWPFLVRRIKLRRPKWEDIKKHIKPIIILFIPVLAISIFSYMDKIMLGNNKGMMQTGFYENSEKIISIPKSFIQAFGAVMLPRTANLVSHGNEKESNEYLIVSVISVVIIISAAAFGLAGIANTFVLFFWGENFLDCGEIIAAMCPALFFSAFGNVIRTQYLIPRARDKEYTISLVIGAGLNFVVNMILIPYYGALGAVIATVLAEFAMTCFQTITVIREIDLKRMIKASMPFLIIGVVMYKIIKTLEGITGHYIVDLILEVIAGGICYITLSTVYIWISKNTDLSRIREIVKSKIRRNKSNGE